MIALKPRAPDLLSSVRRAIAVIASLLNINSTCSGNRVDETH